MKCQDSRQNNSPIIVPIPLASDLSNVRIVVTLPNMMVCADNGTNTLLNVKR